MHSLFLYGRNREPFILSDREAARFAALHSMSTILRGALNVRTVTEINGRRALA